MGRCVGSFGEGTPETDRVLCPEGGDGWVGGWEERRAGRESFHFAVF